MRSVVVVLPASMWAMMPMLRVFSSEYCRSTVLPRFYRDDLLPPASRSVRPAPCARWSQAKRGVRLRPPLRWPAALPAIVCERLVGLRHLVRVFALLHGGAPVVGGIEQLRRQLLRHAPFRTPARGADDPPHGE